MAVNLKAISAAAGQAAGVTTPAGTASITLTLPATGGTTEIGDRVFVVQVASNTSATTPANWNVLGTKDLVVGSSLGAPAAAGGQRYMTVYWRDRDSAWAMPSFDLTSATQNSHWIFGFSLGCDPTETFDTPTISSAGEDVGTANTAHSAVTGSFTTIAKAFLAIASVSNDNVTSTGGTLTQTGGAFGTVTERGDGGTATGNDVAGKVHTCSVTTGATAAMTFACTLSAASQGGSLVIQQTATYGGSTPGGAFLYDAFRDVDGTNLTSHTSDSGHTWTANPAFGGSMTVQGNAGIGSGQFYSSAVPASANYEVEAQMIVKSIIAANGTGVAARMDTTAGTMYYCYLYGSGSSYLLFIDRFVAGAYTGMSSAAIPSAPSIGSTHTIRLKVQGDQISGYYDDTLVVGPLTSNHITAAGRPGISASASTATTGLHYQSLTAKPPLTGTVAATLQEPTAALAGEQASSDASGTIGASMSGPTASLAGAQTQTGMVAASAKSPTASLAGVQAQSGTIGATLTEPTTVLAGAQAQSGAIAAALTVLAASLTGAQAQTGTIAATLTEPVAALTGVMQPSGTIGASVSSPTASLTGTQGENQTGTIGATVSSTTASLAGVQAQSGTIAAILTEPVAALAGSHASLDASGTIAASLQPAITTQTGTTRLMLGQWGFLDNLEDTSGNGRHGTLTTGSPSYVDGPTTDTRGLKFSGTTDSVSFGRTGLEPSLEGITVMGWVRLEGNPSDGTTIILNLLNKARASNSSRLRIGIQYTTATNVRRRAAVARWKDDLNVSDTGPTTWTDNNWHHLAIVDGNNRYAYYVDGSEETSVGRALGSGANTAWENFPWRTGHNPDISADRGARPEFSVSGIRVFQGELTSAEISAWMNTPIEGGGPSGTIGASVSSPTATVTGVMQPAGTIGATVSSPTAALTGAQAQSGTVAATLTEPVAAATGVMQPSGAIAASLRPLTTAVVGAQTQSGAIAATLTEPVAAATGAMQPSGTIDTTLQEPTSALSGAQTQTGTIAVTAPQLDAEASGTQAAPNTIEAAIEQLSASLAGVMQPSGTITAALEDLTTTLTGAQAQSGTIAATLTEPVAALTGVMQPSGSIAATLTEPVAGLTGSQTQAGTVAAILTEPVAALTGAMLPTGVIAAVLTEPIAALSATGISVGAIAATLTEPVAALAGSQPFTGTMAVTLTEPVAALTGAQTLSGAIAATLTEPVTALAGALVQTGTVTASLRPLAAALSGLNIAALGAITASIQSPTTGLAGAQVHSGTIVATLQSTETALAGSQLITGTISTTVESVTAFLFGATGISAFGAIAVTLQPLFVEAEGVVLDNVPPYVYRTHAVRPESRIAGIRFESRVTVVSYQSRTTTTRPETRVYDLPMESRLAAV